MKKAIVLAGMALALVVWAKADDMGGMAGMKSAVTTPAPSPMATPKAKPAKKSKKAKPKKEAAAKSYTCPMDGGHFDKPGKCPKCGMDLVPEKS
jgi:hypothetical protein